MTCSSPFRLLVPVGMTSRTKPTSSSPENQEPSHLRHRDS